MRHAISALLVLTVIGTASAQVTLETGNLPIPGYYDKLKGIVDNQIIGHRTVVEIKLWEPLKPDDSQPMTITRRVAVHGKNLWMSRVDILPPRLPTGGDGKDRYAHIVTPDAYYALQRNASGGKYSVTGHGTEWGNPQSYRNTVGLFSATAQLFQPREVAEVLETVNDDYEGRPTKRIALRTRDGARWVAHIDRTTFQHLYSESDKVLDFKRRVRVDGKSVARTDYREEGGRLWPTRHERYQVSAGGKKQPLQQLTFLEYAPHTPTADELDMEKQFGVKPIPHGPRPDAARPRPYAASRSRLWWVFGAACVLAVGAVLVVAFRRRRPATET